MIRSHSEIPQVVYELRTDTPKPAMPKTYIPKPAMPKTYMTDTF